MVAKSLKGIIPPVPTIVDAAGKLDRAGMGRLLDRLIADGANGVLILGSGGEFCHMTKEMRFEVAEFATKYINGRVAVLLGISSPSTAEAIEFGKHAETLGVTAALALNPYYALLNDDCMYGYFQQLAENIDIPLLLYNFPTLTGQEIKVSVIEKLAADVPNIVGIKDTVDKISHTRDILNRVRPVRNDFVVLAGFDEYIMDVLILGGNGGIPATANFAPQLACGVYNAFVEKRYEDMFATQRQLSRLQSIYTLETPFFSTIKEAIRLCGLDISTEVLSPARKLSPEKRDELIATLNFAGINYTS